MPFKDFILKICALRNDSWSRDEQFRVESTISDLHAADARYYQDCKTEFLHSSYVERLANSSKEEMDLAFPSPVRHMKNNEKETWSSGDIHNIYAQNGGYKLNRRSLVSVLCDHFGDTLFALSAPGLANILTFRKSRHFQLHNTSEFDNSDGREIAARIRQETRKTEKTLHKVHLDSDSICEGYSDTLMDLLAEMKFPKLYSTMIGMFLYLSYLHFNTLCRLIVTWIYLCVALFL